MCASDGKNLLNKNLQIIIMKFNVNVNFGVAKCYDSRKALTFCKLKFGNEGWDFSVKYKKWLDINNICMFVYIHIIIF